MIRQAVSLVFCAVLSAIPTVTNATPTVLLGSDYLETTAGTAFMGAPFVGVPIGPGSTDTIVHRMANADFPSGVGSSTAPIPIELVALNLVSAVPINLFAVTDFYYITLQSARGGPASLGTMTIKLITADDGLPGTPQGTFDSFFDVFFDIRAGSLTGPIVFSNDLPLTNAGALWDANPAPGTVVVTGGLGSQTANLHNGKTADQLDFFPLFISEQEAGVAVHNVVPAAVPEPASLLLAAFGLAGLGMSRRNRA